MRLGIHFKPNNERRYCCYFYFFLPGRCDLIRKERTLEKNVIVGSVRAHLEERVIVDVSKCIVFEEGTQRPTVTFGN